VVDTAARVASVSGVAAVATGAVAATSAWAWYTAPERLWRHRVVPDQGTGPRAFALAMVGWDLIYYANHRFMHECRAMWAIHVVHHSSQRYNLGTALRQPVADALGIFVPYGLLSLAGIRPSVIASARAWNLLYQYWIHTDTISTLGPAEQVLNTPSAHRVHHASNRRYLDRNHGGILIVWDRLFGTYTPEDPAEPVVYGLTTNINTFNPLRVATHEHAALLADVAAASDWRTRLGHVVRGPGWQPAA
jgi:sterol desaturase/sphingolipid hydroxylase (fatty acid hydroxylase superfamily)